MKDVNVVTMTGRLTRDCELKYTNSGLQICSFAMAVNRKVKKGDEWVDEASFFDCTLFGKFAESMARYLLKGTPLAVSGSMKQERWETEDGSKRSRVVVLPDSIRLFGSKDSRSSDDSGAPQQQRTVREIFEDDVPF